MHTPTLAAVVGLLLVPATATAATPAAQSRAAWKQVAPATFTLDADALADVLEQAPLEGRATVRGLTISVPAPDGGFERFAVAESPVMEPALAAAHPEIKTYTARGLDDPSASARLDLTPLGFHAAVRSASGAWYVDPRGGKHVAYRRTTVTAEPFEEPGALRRFRPAAAPRPAAAGGDPVTLRTYRLALISDPGYAANTPGTTTEAKVVLVNRLDQIYEQDLAIRIVLVAGNDQLNLDTAALATGAAGPCAPAACYTNAQLQTCDEDLLSRTNAVAGRILGAASYDLAHVVTAGNGGGLAGLGVVGTPYKGQACTSRPAPVGDAFDVDFVAHEVGHQFGAEHTFNSGAPVCKDNRAGNRAVRVEPGSGSSIMAYAGVCGTDNLQPNSDPYFSQASIGEIAAQALTPEEQQSPVQQVALNDFGAGDSFRIGYAGGTSAQITDGGNFTANGIRTAIEGIGTWPAGATVFVNEVSRGGFTVFFDGVAAPPRLEITNVSGFDGGFAGVTAVSGSTRYGGAPQATDNRTPDVGLKAAAAYTIPARTPFLLDATGSDLDGDLLTYLWEQNDGGGGADGSPLQDVARTDGPLFRMFGAAPGGGALNAAPTATWRSFPDVDQVLAGDTNAATGACATVACFSEVLPTAAWTGLDGPRTLHFRVTARDNHPGFGGTSRADLALTVAAGTGPFRLTSQAAAATAGVGAALPVTWDVAGTDGYAPQVRITLSLDGGRTFTKVLAAATPNDGAEVVTTPRVTTTNGRIKVEGVGNVFYDAARGALTVDAGSPVLVNAPASADLGAATVGAAGTPVTITFSSDGPAAATTGALTAGGADAGAVNIVSDGCSARTLAGYSECAVTARLVPSRPGAHSATLSLASDDPASPATVTLTGTATAAPVVVAATPTPTPTPVAPVFDPARRAAGLLGTATPFAVGTAGNLRLYTKTRSTKLGKPKATMLLAAAVCAGGPCSGKATAKLTLTPRKGRKRAYTFTIARSLKLADGGGIALRLKLSRADRKRIDAARKAALTLTVTNGTRRVSRAFTLTT